MAEQKETRYRKLFAVVEESDSGASEHIYTYIYIYLGGAAGAGAPAESSLSGQPGFKAELVQTLGRAQATETS